MCRPVRTAFLALLIAAGCGSLADHPLAVTAREEVARNERAFAVLGKPVSFASRATGRSNDTDGIAALEFEARGPAGTGLVVVEGKKVGGEWGVTHLELRPSGGGERVSLTSDLEARTGTDTPKFDPAATQRPSAAPVAPPPGDVEIALPPGAPGG